jgi:hypothetical protein
MKLQTLALTCTSVTAGASVRYRQGKCFTDDMDFGLAICAIREICGSKSKGVIFANESNQIEQSTARCRAIIL